MKFFKITYIFEKKISIKKIKKRRAVRRAVGGSRIYILGRRTVGCRAALVGNLLGVPIGDNAFAQGRAVDAIVP